MAALAQANDIRSQRAQLKSDLKAGRRSIDKVLLDPPGFLESATIFDLLRALPRYGRVKVNRILTRTRISPSRTVGSLTERQRAELVALLLR